MGMNLPFHGVFTPPATQALAFSKHVRRRRLASELHQALGEGLVTLRLAGNDEETATRGEVVVTPAVDLRDVQMVLDAHDATPTLADRLNADDARLLKLVPEEWAKLSASQQAEVDAILHEAARSMTARLA